MTCPSSETIDAYIDKKLTREEQDAFEEHIFNCESCFEEVQARMDIRDVMGEDGEESPPV